MGKIREITESGWGDEPTDSNETEGSASDKSTSAFDNVAFLNGLDEKFDSIYKEVTKSNSEELLLFSSQVQKMELSDFAQKLSKKTSKQLDDNQKLIEDLMNDSSGDILKVFDDLTVQSNRKKMYEMYHEISNINPIAFRMLQVYINNILYKNSQSKQFLNVSKNEYNPYVSSMNDGVGESIEKFIKTVILFFDVQSRMKNKIVPETLKLGDYYMEIVDLEPVDEILNNNISILNESVQFGDDSGSKITKMANLALFEDCSGIGHSKPIVEHTTLDMDSPFGEKMANILSKKLKNNFLMEESDVDFLTDVMGNNDNYDTYADFDIDEFQSLDFDGVGDLYLRLISPANVLKIEKDGNHYGFLVIEDIDDGVDANNEINLYQQFLRDDSSSGDGKNNGTEEALTDALVNSITNKLSEIITQDTGFLSEMPQELKTSLRLIAYEKIRKKTKLKFRFIQSNRLINFHTTIDKFKPYGTSIFDPIVLPVKMYTIAMMSSVISRLSRASVIRKWNIEVGTKRNYPEMVEKLKKDLKTKSISYDDLGSIKSISQVMTDYRDIAVISQNGQRTVDMELMPMHDRAMPLNDMMDLRNELVAATGVPSVYLNISDGVEMRETLVNINIGFSHTISSLQGNFEDGLNEMLNSIFEIILAKNNISADFKLTQFFKITLNHPLILQLQQNESLISTVSNIVGLFKQSEIKFDPLMIFQKYLPDMNWDDLEHSGEAAIKREVKDKLMSAEGGGGGF